MQLVAGTPNGPGSSGISTRSRFRGRNSTTRQTSQGTKIIMEGGNRASATNKRYDYGEMISALSNLSIQYNLGVIAPALLLLDHTRVTGPMDSNSALYPRTNDEDSLLKSAVFIGAILGQCSMGFIGDALFGYLSLAMIFTNALALLGTLGCAVTPLVGRGEYQNSQQVYTLLAIFRGILGYGVGGKYPLGSAMRAQAAETDAEHPDKKKHRAKEVAKGFFWQTPGAILPYVVALALLLFLGDEHSAVGRQYAKLTCIQYMVLVGTGALPSLLVIMLSWKQLTLTPSSTEELGFSPLENGGRRICRLCLKLADRRRAYTKVDKANKSAVSIALQNKSYWNKLIGTGLSWALYDFVYYGTAFNQPEILSAVLGDSDGLVGVSWRDALVAMMGMPGVILAIRTMEEPIGGLKPLQAWGFVAIGLACLLLLCFYDGENYAGTKLSKWGGFISCSILICALNWGCNISTYVLPMEVFPKEIRSSFHGLSAGMGKCGALLGSVLFTQLNSISISLTFLACIMSCCLGIAVTWRFVDPPKQGTFFVARTCKSRDNDEEKAVLSSGGRQGNEAIDIHSTIPLELTRIHTVI